jgi:hypothetical protein
MKEAILNNITTLNLDEQRKLEEGLRNMPVHKMHEQAQYFHNTALPMIVKKHGTDNGNYKFYTEVADSLAWAILILRRDEVQKRIISEQQMLLEFYINKANFYLQELTKYTTMEDLLMGESFELMRKTMAAKAAELVTKQ